MSRHYVTALAALGLLLGCLASALPPTQAAAGPTIADVQASATSVGLYEKFELTFNVANTVATYPDWPYDPAPPPGVPAGVGITVEGLFSNDDWATVVVQPAFLYQDYTRSQRGSQEHLYPQGDPVWKIRFAPPRTGDWRYRIRAADASGATVYPANGDLSFTVAPSDSPGFVRVSLADPRYFEFDDGAPFVGVGHNADFSTRSATYDADAVLAVLAANRVNLVRASMSASSIAGSAWLPWTSHHLDYDGSLPPTSLSAEQAYGDGDLAMKLWPDNPCMFQGFLGRIPVLPGQTYRLQVRLKTVDVTGPQQPGAPYGFVVKLAEWLGAACAQPNDRPPLTPHVAGSADWQIVAGTIIVGPEQYFLDNLYLILENATGGAAYVDEVILQQDLGNGRYGPNLIRKPRMNFHTYFDPASAWAWDYILDRAAERGVYLKLVVLDKDDWIYNHLAPDGSFAPEGNNDNFYAAPGAQVRWLHQTWWRYLAARWGYSTAVHSWELLDDGDPFNSRHYEQANAFARYVHENGGHRRLATTSFRQDFPVAEFWGNAAYPDLDYADLHATISTGWGRYPAWGNGPSSPLSFEADPAHARGGAGHSLRVPGDARFHSATITPAHLAIRGRGEWLIRFWMKAEGWTGDCDRDVPASMAGPRLAWTLDAGRPEQASNVAPPADAGQDMACSAPAGSYDWMQFSNDRTADGRAAPHAARLILKDDLPHTLEIAAQNSFGHGGAAWIDDIEIVAPDGAVLAINGSMTLDAMDKDAARYTQAYSLLYGGASPAGAQMPLVRGEAGLDYAGSPPEEQADLARDTEGVWLHNLVWGQINPGGMCDLYQWPDNIWDNGLHRHFKPFRDFMDGIPLNNGLYRDAGAIASQPDLRAWGQVDATHGQAHLWIQNARHTWRNVVDGASIPALEGAITIPALHAGSYQVEWWDANGGGVVYAEIVEAGATQECGELGCLEALTLTLPWALTTDVAVKVSQAQVDLAASHLSVDKSTARAGETLIYQLVLVNDGKGKASRVVVVNPIPNHTTYVPGSLTPGSGPVLHNGQNLTWVGDVPAGDSVTVSFAVTVDASLTEPAAIVDEATINHGNKAMTRQTMTLVNAFQAYLPLTFKSR